MSNSSTPALRRYDEHPVDREQRHAGLPRSRSTMCPNADGVRASVCPLLTAPGHEPDIEHPAHDHGEIEDDEARSPSHSRSRSWERPAARCEGRHSASRLPGPPPVSIHTSSTVRSASIRRMKTVARIAGRSIGKVTCQKIWQRLAPSICACSNGSLGIADECREQRQRDERRPVPDVHDDRRRERLVGEAAETAGRCRTSGLR